MGAGAGGEGRSVGGAVWGLRGSTMKGWCRRLRRKWGPLSVWGAARRSWWRGFRGAPTSCPGSADARGLAAEVARTAAVEEGPPRAAQGSPRPGSGPLRAPIQL